MRKITKQAVEALTQRKKFSKNNTEVDYDSTNGRWCMYLHGNLIAELNDFGALLIRNAGWFSNTTKERLNGLPGVSIYQKNYKWYLNGQHWNGERQFINWIRI